MTQGEDALKYRKEETRFHPDLAKVRTEVTLQELPASNDAMLLLSQLTNYPSRPPVLQAKQPLERTASSSLPAKPKI